MCAPSGCHHTEQLFCPLGPHLVCSQKTLVGPVAVLPFWNTFKQVYCCPTIDCPKKTLNPMIVFYGPCIVAKLLTLQGPNVISVDCALLGCTVFSKKTKKKNFFHPSFESMLHSTVVYVFECQTKNPWSEFGRANKFSLKYIW